jgi:secondary thiamine-phosphate synthase enzyme
MLKIEIKTSARTDLVDITRKVQETVDKMKIKKGVCLVFVPHTTAGITINENADVSVQEDILSGLNKIAPEDGKYHHREGNSDAHIKTTLMNSQILVIIEDGRLALGAWQGIYLCEFDGPRTRQVWIKIV